MKLPVISGEQAVAAFQKPGARNPGRSRGRRRPQLAMKRRSRTANMIGAKRRPGPVEGCAEACKRGIGHTIGGRLTG
jgi:hypothetical protein